MTVALPIPLSREQSGDLLAPILAAVADYDLPANLRERPVQLRIYLIHEDRRALFTPRYELALQAVEQGLTGAELIIYLTEPF